MWNFPKCISFPRAAGNYFLNTWSISKTICHSPSELLYFSELKKPNMFSPHECLINLTSQHSCSTSRFLAGKSTKQISLMQSIVYLIWVQRSFRLHVEFLQPLQLSNLIITSIILFSLQVQIVFVVLLKKYAYLG